MATRNEVVELVIKLSDNLDEVEQFASLVPEIIRHCEKKFLISILEGLMEGVKENIEMGREHLIMHSDEELQEMFKQVEKLVGKN